MHIRPAEGEQKVALHQHEIELGLARIYEVFLNTADIDLAISAALERMGRLTGAGRCYLFLFRNENEEIMDNTHEWCAAGVTPERENLQNLPCEIFPWWMAKLRRNESIHIQDVAELPPEAEAEREILSAQGIRSVLVFPVHSGGDLVGFIGLDNVQEATSWDERCSTLLQIASQIIGSSVTRQRSEEAVRHSEQRFRSLVQNALDCVSVVSATGEILYETPSVSTFGYDPAEWKGRTFLERIHPAEIERIAKLFAELVADPGGTVRGETVVRHGDGSWRHCEWVAANLLHDPAVCGIVINYRDVTERRTYEQQLQYQAYHDALTGLPNRLLFLQRLREAQMQSLASGTNLAVLFMDLDRFKVVNDSLGHTAGDQLLVQVARRLSTCVRARDTVARLGGDEFILLLEEIDLTEARRIADRIMASLQAPVHVGGRDLVINASLGIRMSAGDLEAVDDLIRDADSALYHAKFSGRGRYHVFSEELMLAAMQQLEMESDLRRAVAQQEFELFYQPIINMESGAVTGAEALLRWHHPTRGLLLPGEFLGMAEETGLILEINQWVLETACRQIRCWIDQGTLMQLSINLSAKELHSPALVENVKALLDRYQIPGNLLQVEVTESDMMLDRAGSARILRDMRDLGVRVALDDFGAGHSSLKYVKEFGVDVIKVDRSFVSGLPHHGDDLSIVTAIAALAGALGLTVVAEGVEREEHAAALRAIGCNLAQGFHFARPLPLSQLSPGLSDRFSA